jgi:hypothetical protein
MNEEQSNDMLNNVSHFKSLVNRRSEKNYVKVAEILGTLLREID